MIKTCRHCKSEKPLFDFYKSSHNKDGFDAWCKLCRKEHTKAQYKKRKDKIKETHKKWMENGGKEKRAAYYYQWQKNRFETNPFWAFQRKARSLIKSSFNKKGLRKNSKTEQMLGCDIEFFQLYMEMQFSKEMCWDNHGEWHVDHIVPIAIAKNELELIPLNHYSNLRPLWKSDNMSKGAKLQFHGQYRS